MVFIYVKTILKLAKLPLFVAKLQDGCKTCKAAEFNDSLTNKRLTSDTAQLLVKRSKGDIRTETIFRLENICQWRQSKKSLFFFLEVPEL